MNSTYITFPCGNVTLEGELHLPQESGSFPGVVVCHTHPLYGGDMFSSVVVAVCQVLSLHSIAALRFNFRGVGECGGDFGGGIAEQEDVRAALAFVLSTPDIDSKKIGLAGYSFGARVAMPVALQDKRIKLLALISPPLSDSGWEQLKKDRKSKYLIVGESDASIPLEYFQQHIKDIPDPEQYQVVSGDDHFWWGHEGEVAQKVTRFFASGFGLV
ncbi:alpha/beta hydrolase [Chloroflexota bacterium]